MQTRSSSDSLTQDKWKPAKNALSLARVSDFFTKFDIDQVGRSAQVLRLFRGRGLIDQHAPLELGDGLYQGLLVLRNEQKSIAVVIRAQETSTLPQTVMQISTNYLVGYFLAAENTHRKGALSLNAD